jgi:hypothetical protein
MRTLTSLVTIASLCIASAVLAGQRGGSPQSLTQRDIDAMSARLAGSNAQQAAADAQRLAAAYGALGPQVAGFGPSDYVRNREMARRSLDWLGRASLAHGRDPYAAQAFLASYDSIGRFYQGPGMFYRPGAFVAYAAAMRLAQRLVLLGQDPTRYERALDRYALAYGTFAVANGGLLMPWNFPADLPAESGNAQPVVVLKPTELPAVDASALSPADKAAWTEVRERFRSVAPRVHEARQLLNDLSARLQGQRMTLNPEDAANALKMQGYLDDAAQLISEKQFDQAAQALTRADYVRAKLKGVTGQ